MRREFPLTLMDKEKLPENWSIKNWNMPFMHVHLYLKIVYSLIAECWFLHVPLFLVDYLSCHSYTIFQLLSPVLCVGQYFKYNFLVNL